uniref:Uncharacterized protein n=1 Tax=Anguilla anguilla TaxID=7936 RepID=A0A0E9RSS9_ANGAN
MPNTVSHMHAHALACVTDKYSHPVLAEAAILLCCTVQQPSFHQRTRLFRVNV